MQMSSRVMPPLWLAERAAADNEGRPIALLIRALARSGA